MFVEEPLCVQGHLVRQDGKPFQPGVHYFVGGATKMYGAALFRLREEDFSGAPHRRWRDAGLADAATRIWSRTTRRRKKLYHVHGQRGDDPTDPPASAPYPFPPVSHEPRIQELADD